MPCPGSRGAPVLLVVLAIVAMLGHHCVMPLGAEAAARHMHDSTAHDGGHSTAHDGGHNTAHDGGHGHDGGDSSHAVHPSDCHVMATKAPMAAPGLVVVARSGFDGLVRADDGRAQRAPVLRAPD